MNDKSNVKILLNDLNIYLCCKLCCGYLVDATTITECLHSCKYVKRRRCVMLLQQASFVISLAFCLAATTD